MPPTEIDEAAARVQAGRLPDRTGAGIPGRFGIRTQRSSGPQRSVSDPGKQNASATCIFRLCCRKTREKREGERRSPSGRRIHPEAYRTLGRQNRKCGRGEIGASASPARPCGARERGRLVRPVSGLRGSAFPGRNAGRARNICKPDYTLCYTSHSGRCFRPILSDGWKPSGMEPAGKYLHLAHSVY